jgi:hypothetical protein
MPLANHSVRNRDFPSGIDPQLRFFHGMQHDLLKAHPQYNPCSVTKPLQRSTFPHFFAARRS